ncbi:MAG: hypothetical protein HN348_21130 [Proteobacteria bacterium]|jgi:hypothetical protein|nr:hypothetical protein [Pseudomonadota bacterium]
MTFDFEFESVHRAKPPVFVLGGRLLRGTMSLGDRIRIPLLNDRTVIARIVDFKNFDLKQCGVLPAESLSAGQVHEYIGVAVVVPGDSSFNIEDIVTGTAHFAEQAAQT